MKTRVVSTIALAAWALASPASADTLRVGIVAPFSGAYAIFGQQFKEGIEAYVADHGHDIGGHEIELIYKDTGGPNADKARALVQELLIQDRIDYLAGFTFTPNALAIAPLIDQTETPTVIFNAATSSINHESEYFLRTSYTLWQVSVPLAEWAYDQGIHTVATAVSDYGPGIDAETAFREAFEAKGGEIVDAIRIPLATNDFTPFVQRVREQAPEGMFVFLPGGPPAFGMTKAYNQGGLREAGIRFLGTAETLETDLPGYGDVALGLTTAYFYSSVHESPENDAFLERLHALHPVAIATSRTVGAYDGMHMIYEMIRAAGGDGPAALEAAKTMEWVSPRGPVRMDPETRTLVQQIYIREVERDAESGKLVNREKGVIATVGDLGWDK